MIFSFGETKHQRIEVEVMGYERPPTGEYYDDNWLTVIIRVRAGGFHGQAEASILTDELPPFVVQLEALFESLNGSAEFSTIEEQLSLRLVGDGKGHVSLSGLMLDQAGSGNRLQFTLCFDQSQLGASIRELRKVTASFPIRNG